MRTATANEKETSSGRLIDLLCPLPENVDVEDIAMSLAYQNRFDGHAGVHYSVAQHSIIVASLLDGDDRIHGLLHDAPEYLIGDMSSPMKSALRSISPEFKRAWAWIEHAAERAIYAALGFPLPTEEQRARVKAADMIVLATEQREIMGSPNRWNVPAPADIEILPMRAEKARVEFLRALAEHGVSIPASIREIA